MLPVPVYHTMPKMSNKNLASGCVNAGLSVFQEFGGTVTITTTDDPYGYIYTQTVDGTMDSPIYSINAYWGYEILIEYCGMILSEPTIGTEDDADDDWDEDDDDLADANGYWGIWQVLAGLTDIPFYVLSRSGQNIKPFWKPPGLLISKGLAAVRDIQIFLKMVHNSVECPICPVRLVFMTLPLSGRFFYSFTTMPRIFRLLSRKAVISSASRGWAAMRARSYTWQHSIFVVSSSGSLPASA